VVKAICAVFTVLAAATVLLAAGSYWTGTGVPAPGETIWGTWYLAVDSTPFGIPGGTLPALLSIHQDGTLTITDAGDLGSSPFTTTDTAQQGIWVQTGNQTFETTTLFLRKDEVSGELEGWHRVRATLQFGTDRDHLAGFAEEEVLACDPAGPTPFKLLNCPNPITSVFPPAPFPIPIELTRLPAG
jgi:hypothetical protein